MNYREFLEGKFDIQPRSGFDVDLNDIHPALKPHQAVTARWALSGGRRLVAASFGLGKTIGQCEIARQVHLKTGSKFLQICPLGVRHQFFTEDGPKVGIQWEYCRNDAEIQAAQTPYILTNYERVRDGNITPANHDFAGVSLDEGSTLRSLGSKTYQVFSDLMASIPYRFVATATPAPNEYRELNNYAEFLGITDRGLILNKYFKRNSSKAGDLQLIESQEQKYWLWVSTWALFLFTPGDLGYSNDGYDLPEMDIRWHRLGVDDTRAWGQTDNRNQYRLLLDAASGVREASAEKRATMPERISRAMEMLEGDASDNQWIIWCHLNDEQAHIERALKERDISFSSIFGALDVDEAEKRLYEWKRKETRILVSKPIMLGSGVNLQQCHRVIFLGIDYKFNDFIQAVKRVHRFMQTEKVEIDILYAESEDHVKETLLKKWRRYDVLIEKMRAIIRKYNLSEKAIYDGLDRIIGVNRIMEKQKLFTAVNNDCVLEMENLPDSEFGMILSSIPFGNHYEYSDCYDEKTEVLTRRGWLSFGDIRFDDTLATVNRETLALEWQVPSKIVWETYKGPMLHFYGRSAYDLMITPNHKMFVETRVGNANWKRKASAYQLLRADELAVDFVHRRWHMAAVAVPASGARPDYIEIPQLKQRIMPGTNIVKRVSAADFMQLAGWYLSEGSCIVNGNSSNGRISIAQGENNAEYRREIIEMFERLGFSPSGASLATISVSNISLATFLVENFGSGSHNKQIPRWVKDLHPHLLCVLRDTMMKGDGSTRGYAYTSFSEQLRDDFQEICMMSGWRASVKGVYVGIGKTNIYPEIRERPVIFNYDGMIGCATVPNHTLIVRRNGYAVVSGNSYEDFGHNSSDTEFWKQMDFLIPELLRVLKPGRVAAIHVKDRILYGHQTKTGFMEVAPFSDECVLAFRKHGWLYEGRRTIVTDVVRENNSTYRLGWTEMSKDATKMGSGLPEYLLMFRKPPTGTDDQRADEPVTKDKEEYTRGRWQIDAHALWRSNGNVPLTAGELYDYEAHVNRLETLDRKGNLPSSFFYEPPKSPSHWVWDDVFYMRTLNTEQSHKRVEKHICPLPFDIVERAIRLYSNEGDLILDPFAGLFTVIMKAVEMSRRGYGIELNREYFEAGLKYCQIAEQNKLVPNLFDYLATVQQSISKEENVDQSPES